jgi:hypothetical protein
VNVERHLRHSNSLLISAFRCVRQPEADFSQGCTGRKIGNLLFATHPYHPGSREQFCASTQCPVILAVMNLYSPLQHLVLAISCKAGQLAILRPDRGEAMRDSGYESRRIFLPCTSVNKGKKRKGRDVMPQPFATAAEHFCRLYSSTLKNHRICWKPLVALSWSSRLPSTSFAHVLTTAL